MPSKARIFDHTTSAEHTCRGFRRLEYHLFVETYHLDLCSCTPSCASFPNPPHMSLSGNRRPLVCGLHQTEILREIVSCIDTCGEAFVEHSLIDRTKIQHIKTRGRKNTNLLWHHLVHTTELVHGSCSFLKSFGCHTFRLYLYHHVDTIAVSVCLKAHNHQCFRTPFPSGNRKRNRTCNSCAHRPNSRAGRNFGLQRNRLFAKKKKHRFKMVNALTASQNPEPLNVISRLHPKKLVKAMELQHSSCRATFNFTSESSVFGMRTMFSSASVTAFELL